MTLEQAVFLVVAGLAVAGALGMVVLRNLLHAVLGMMLSFLAVAAVFILLEAGFLAVVQILIYVGALTILTLFAIMLSRDVVGHKVQVSIGQWPLALLASAALFMALGILAVRVWAPSAPAAVTYNPDPVVALGLALVGPYALPFEVASVLLLVAVIGAILFAREARP